MTASERIIYPRPDRVVGALLWELIWKNRIVIPALFVFLGLGGMLVVAIDHSPPEVWWTNYARGAAFAMFLGSILLAFAPFTLMDNHGSWRMNSVTSRWSVLPVRTSYLVGVPLAVACVWISGLALVWRPILNRLFPGVDMVYVLAVLLAGVTAAQALAWSLPRKPGQYWILAAVLFLIVLLGAVVPQDRRGWDDMRSQTYRILAALTLGCAALAVWAARRNRCGDWSGELPLAAVRDLVGRPGNGTHVFQRPVASLFWSDVVPGARSFFISWVAVAFLLIGWAWFTLWLQRRGQPTPWLLLSLAVLMEGLPNFAVVWLMAWGLFLGCEPGMGFQTRLSGFRSTRPLSVGMLAGTRISALALIWLLAWGPLLILQQLTLCLGFVDQDLVQITRQTSEIMTSRMVFTASAMVAALPVLLWGRYEGFPTLFLATLVGWAWSWILSGFVHQSPAPPWFALVLGAILAVRLATAGCLLFRGCQNGCVSWRFPLALGIGWIVIVGGIAFTFGLWQRDDPGQVLALAAMIPMVRLAACPLAMAANRHR